MEVSGQLHVPTALPQGKRPRYPLDSRLVGPRADLGAVLKRKNPCPFRELNSCHSARILITIQTELPRLVLYNLLGSESVIN